MAKIAVVTDSIAVIPADLVKKYNISVAPIHITWDRVDYRDSVDLTATEFYERLPKSKTLPTTSSGIQGEFLQIFEGLQGKVDGIAVFTLTGDLGACYKSALNGKELAASITPIEVVDTRTVMMAEGFIVLAAAKAAAANGSMSDVINAAKEVMPKTHIFWAMDTLEYLRKGGRVSMPQAVMASWLHVKPITGIINGKVEPLAKPLTRAKAVAKLFDIMDERIADKKTPLHVAVLHGNVTAEAQRLEAQITARYKPVELLRSEITPVIGAHVGPGALGMAFYNE